MNPLQQMELARFDHQERLHQSQRNQFARLLNRKSFFSFSLVNRKETNRSSAKQSNIQCDTVAVS